MAADLGVSLDCALDYTPTMASVSGIRSVENAIIRRLNRSTGTLWYDRSYGRNLCDFVNSGVTKYEIEQSVEAEILEEERVRATEAILRVTAQMPTAGVCELTISCDTNIGPFEFVLRVADAKIEVLRRK